MAQDAKIWALAAGLVLPLLAATNPTQAAAQDEEAIGRGAKAWAENCSRCHNMRAPDEFRDDQWRPIVYHMRVRAGLTGQETRDILKFLQATN
jgi:mono/diheme cytochrome c family protein